MPVEPTWRDPRVADAFARQLRTRAEWLSTGRPRVGWKLGFSSPAALATFDLAGPVLGYLTETVPDGGSLSLAGWTRALAEPEVAVHLGADVAADARPEAVRAHIAGVGAAIELADAAGGTGALDDTIEHNVFNRGVVLGPVSALPLEQAQAALSARVLVDGNEVAATPSAAETAGDLVALTGYVARFLAAFGERLRAGDAIITGSLTAPVPLEGATRLDVELPPIGSLSLRLR